VRPQKNMKLLLILLAAALLTVNRVAAQWIKINDVPAQHIVALTAFDDKILAAAETGLLYESGDGGVSWSPIVVSNTPIVIITLRILDAAIYVGTFHNGIFSSTDSGATWINTGSSLPAVTGIEKHGEDLYAATLGAGVYKFDQSSGIWMPFNDSLPTYSVNVNTILSTANSLFIGAGANGTFYRYNFTINGWHEEYYYSLLRPGLLIDKLISTSDTIFAVNGNRIIRSEDNGVSWKDDNIGSHNGYFRTIYAGINNHYTLTNIIPEGTWVQQRSNLSAGGTTWANNEEFLSGGYSYDIFEFQNKLFLAKADGLYVKELTSGVKDPINKENDVRIAPNPSGPSGFHISSDVEIREITISSMSGQILFDENISGSEFTLQPNLQQGIYVINFTLLNGRKLVKKIIID